MSNQLLATISTRPWATAPAEGKAGYSRCWQRVSVALQIELRRAIPEIYFRDASRFEDRDEAHQYLAYAASQPFHGQSRTEFTYDVADTSLVGVALSNTGRRMQAVLAPVERRLREIGNIPLALRYSPVWYVDVLREVRHRHRTFLRLLACESKVIEAVIDLGTRRNAKAANRFERVTTAALRCVAGFDFSELVPMLIARTTEVLTEQRRAMNRRDNVVHTGIFHRDRARAAGSPNGGIGGQENRDDGRPDGRSQMTDAGIVADEHGRF